MSQATVAPTTQDSPRQSFHDLGLAPRILETLDKLGFTIPTPIQSQAIPIGLKGQDIIGIAQTGTGKTLAFGLPLLQRLIEQKGRCGRALILLPTRELALQVEESLERVGRPFGVKTAVLIGGAPIRPQITQLKQNPDIIVATPGRLIDHLQTRNVDLRTVDALILDEADRMLDMGFAPQIKQILKSVPPERQTMLFSATMPDQIVQIANEHMKSPVRVEIARAGTAAEGVTQEYFVIPQEDKTPLLETMLRDYEGSVLVFARTRSRAHRVARQVRMMGHKVAEIHSDRTLPQRRAALDGFKDGSYRVLIATDIAARGIDVTGIELVLNYDLPDNAEDYVHRIGRTGRAGMKGHAISFAAPDQSSDIREIERLIRSELKVAAQSQHQFNASRSSSVRGRTSTPRGNGGRPRTQSSSAPRPSSAPRSDRPQPSSERGPMNPTRSLQRGPRSFSGRGS